MSYSEHSSGRSPSEHRKSSSVYWQAFQTIRELRVHLGLRPAHLATLQALLSFLKPGEGQIVFASNAQICLRAGGIDERTFRRHAQALAAAGLVERHDSPNRKRYRITGSDGEQLGFGFSVEPMIAQMSHFLALSQKLAQEAKQKKFLRKKILTNLALVEATNGPEETSNLRKVLRRQLTLTQYEELERQVSSMFKATETEEVTGSGGQTVRHLSMSEKKETYEEAPAENEEPLALRSLLAMTSEAQSFSLDPVRSWTDVYHLAITLAPMVGLSGSVYGAAQAKHGRMKVAATVLLLLQIKKIRNIGAYFYSIMLGKRADSFNVARLVQHMSSAQSAAEHIDPLPA